MATKNNWLSTNISKRLKEPNIDFKVIVNNRKYDNVFFEDACLKTAKELASKYKVFIPLSGGMDSEYVLNLFENNSLPYTPIIVETPGNSMELFFAHLKCKSISQTPVILKKTEAEMLSCFYDEIFMKLNGYGHNSVSAFICAKYALENGGIAVIGEHGFDGVNEWDFYNDALLGEENSINFFLYDINVHASMTREFIKYGKQDHQEFKTNLYKINPRPKMKYEYSSLYNDALKKIQSRRVYFPNFSSKIELK